MSICCVYFYIKFIMKGPGVFGPGRGNIMKKRSGVLRTILKTLPAFLALACLAGCSREEREHYKEVEKNAAAYYKNKYGEDVTVVDSKVAGNSGLFGYHGVVDRAYEMSDGTQVYWNDEEEYFADNRQAEEIAAALRSEVIEPALAEMDPDHTVTEYSFNRTYSETSIAQEIGISRTPVRDAVRPCGPFSSFVAALETISQAAVLWKPSVIVLTISSNVS